MDKVTETMNPKLLKSRLYHRWQGLPLLAQMATIAVAIHLAVFTFFSVGSFLPHEKSTDELYELGMNAMAAGKYAEARDLFQKVLDQQPKPLPIFARAADQHRNAERLAAAPVDATSNAALSSTRSQEIGATNSATASDSTQARTIDRPAARPMPESLVKPAPSKSSGTDRGASPDQLIPPELR